MVTYTRNEQGSTLLEITVGVVIVGILTALTYTALSAPQAEMNKTQVKSKVVSTRISVEEQLSYGDIHFPYYDLQTGEDTLVEVRGGVDDTYTVCGSHKGVDNWFYRYSSATDSYSEGSTCATA